VRCRILTRVAQEDVAVVREQFEAVNERDFARAMELYAGDVVLHVDPAAFLEAGQFKGREAVGRWFGAWFRAFEPGYRFAIDEARDLGGVVLLVASHTGKGRESGAEVHGQTAYLYTVRDGRVARVEIYASREKALRAAGEGH
jgi:ketosteroid isomerase-like protein